MKHLIYLNDKILSASEAKVSVFDHGFLYGDGIYETMRVYDGVVFMLDEHLQRLFRSASLISLTIPKDFSGMKIALYDLLRANNLSNAYVRITVSRGVGPIGLDPELCKEPTLVIIAEDFKSYPKSFYEEGIKLIIANTRRNLKDALNPQIKSLNFLNNIIAKIEAKQADANEAIMLNASGYLTEGTISNIFFFSKDILYTPSIDCGILDGITRALVIDLAIRSGIEVKEGFFLPEDLYEASEVFITNTTMEVMPVCRVNNIQYRVGELTRMFLKKYRQEVIAYVKEKKSEGPSIWE
jgi:branched-chain amino acid aminotransferase